MFGQNDRVMESFEQKWTIETERDGSAHTMFYVVFPFLKLLHLMCHGLI